MLGNESSSTENNLENDFNDVNDHGADTVGTGARTASTGAKPLSSYLPSVALVAAVLVSIGFVPEVLYDLGSLRSGLLFWPLVQLLRVGLLLAATWVSYRAIHDLLVSQTLNNRLLSQLLIVLGLVAAAAVAQIASSVIAFSEYWDMIYGLNGAFVFGPPLVNPILLLGAYLALRSHVGSPSHVGSIPQARDRSATWSTVCTVLILAWSVFLVVAMSLIALSPNSRYEPNGSTPLIVLIIAVLFVVGLGVLATSVLFAQSTRCNPALFTRLVITGALAGFISKNLERLDARSLAARANVDLLANDPVYAAQHIHSSMGVKALEVLQLAASVLGSLGLCALLIAAALVVAKVLRPTSDR